MTQEIEITLTLEVDIEFTRKEIHEKINEMCQDSCHLFESITVKDIKEEAELYKTD